MFLMLTGVSFAQITVKSVKGLPFLSLRGERSFQSIDLTMDNLGDSVEVTIFVDGAPPLTVGVGRGNHDIEAYAPETAKAREARFRVSVGQQTLYKGQVSLQPVRKMTVYILPHSHNDIGYTEIQTNVERKQMNNLLTGIDYAEKTKSYPAGARFVWNLEGVYAADLFLNRMNDQQRKRFVEAVHDGGVALNGMYVNTLTGICGPEELLQLFHRGTEVASLCGTPVDAAMISDVPGYTWGTVTAMAQAGIKYFSVAPNYFDRIGDILVQCEDKPFYWIGPNGKDKVLVWIPYRGYALSHGMPEGLTRKFVSQYIAELDRKQFKYDISYIRWSGHGDNATPDMTICDFVKDWNTTYTWPRFIISSTSTAFKAFEDRYASEIPQEKGDWTGYWEDGTGSSAFETAENRATSARMSQGEALWVMKNLSGFPSDTDRDAWRNVILYSEHTWGADVSVTRPLSQKTMEQWIIKKSYATNADSLSRQLLSDALDQGSVAPGNSVDVFNTHSWSTSGVVLVPRELSSAGDLVKDAAGQVLTSQRLSTGELAFMVSEVPPFASRRYTISAGSSAPDATPALKVSDHSLENDQITVGVDPSTGNITSLKKMGVSNEFVDNDSTGGLNEYLFLQGSNLADIQHSGVAKITVKEQGPLVVALQVVSDAPGAANYVREYRLVKGADFVAIKDVLDKLPAELDPHPGDYPWANLHGKESLNVGFPFHVDQGQMRLEIPMGIMQPEKDQIPGSCKNWLEVGNWADVSNQDLGVTWVTLDAPLVEVGGITATLLGGQSNPNVWRKHIDPTQKLYSWALNNHWETNYRAYQDGIITFRYILRPHGAFDALSASTFAIDQSQPLIVAAASGDGVSQPRLRLSNQRVIVLSLRPSLDGKAWMVTLYNPGARDESTGLLWSGAVGAVHISNTGEGVLAPAGDQISVAGQGVVTVRVEKS
ncbi:glycosyl hydrolase family 38 [Dinghuibacter silviterrae]|uniref:Glycosyl hydrolase family 38 n=1 Tax=Dinghuibacter silviterrae TaxID=1539049 RepID=A0A4R8DE97_9BACT|nr:glycosyl hydrolase family 38 [Dinghuibacter silviterrae]